MVDIRERQPGSPDVRSQTAPPWIDELGPGVVKGLTIVGFGLPVLLYVWVTAHYGVNVIYQDQLSDVTVVKASHSHLVPWEALWAQYKDNRLFFPNVFVILLADTTHFDVYVEVLTNAVMMLAAVALIVWAHRRRSPGSPWLYYCPIVFLLLSLVQYQDTLFGYQFAWYLIMLCFAAVLTLLDRPAFSRIGYGAAIAIAVVASFSSLQGLLVWPVGLVLLYHRGRRWPLVVAWSVAGLASMVIYFRNLDFATGVAGRNYLEHHLWPSFKFFLFALGDIVGVSVRPGHGDPIVVLLGALILVIAVLTLVAYGIRRDQQTGGPIGVALICFGLLFAASITEGRGSLGYWGASQSRYTTFDLLVLTGVYLCLLGPPTLYARAEGRSERSPERGITVPRLRVDVDHALRTTGLRIARWTVLGLVGLQVLLGFSYGTQGVISVHAGEVEATQVAARIDQLPDATVNRSLEPFQSASYIRQQIHIARNLHLSQFAGSST